MKHQNQLLVGPKDPHVVSHINHLSTATEVIDALGGTAAVSRLCSDPGREVKMQVVSDWKKRGVFPPGYFLRITDALQDISCLAPLALFQMLPPKHEGNDDELDGRTDKDT